MKSRLKLMALAVSLLMWAAPGETEAANALEVTPPVDLERYVGKWHEIARLPMWFQRGCAHSWATYTLSAPGIVSVVNECITEAGTHKTARGTARVVDQVNRSKLEVVFDNWFSRLLPFLTKGKYWIFHIDPEYQHAIVGTPDRKYLWFLSRSPQMDDGTYQHLVQIARELRFDTSRLVRAEPAGNPDESRFSRE